MATGGQVERFLGWVRENYGSEVAAACEAEVKQKETWGESQLFDLLETILGRGQREERALVRDFRAMRFNSE